MFVAFAGSPGTVSDSPQTTVRPRHVAIIMDGNGRWARRHGLPRNEGHRRGVDNVRTIVRTAGEAGIEFLTLYAFSVENWNRPREEVDALMGLLKRFLDSQEKEMHKQKLRLRTIGRTDELPEPVAGRLREVCDATAGYTRGTLVLALNYGSRTEVTDAVAAYSRAVAAGYEDPDKLTWDRLSRYLYTRDIPDPDLIIRTSGEHRISNFLLMQAAYAEFHFCNKCWPEFGAEDFHAALADYARRERRFGKTSEQLYEGQPTPASN